MTPPVRSSKTVRVQRTSVRLEPDPRRVVLRHLRFGTDEEYARVIQRILALSEADVARTLGRVTADFTHRHRGLEDRFMARYGHLQGILPAGLELSEPRKLLLGAYFLFEYSVESAALFNPSILVHPDQSGLPSGTLRFLLTLRSTGEGHISSISFASGRLDAGGRIRLDPRSPFLSEPSVIANSSYHKDLFGRKAAEIGLRGPRLDEVLGRLSESFTLADLQEVLRDALGETKQNRSFKDDPIAGGLWLLAKSNYELRFPADQDLSECVILPVTPLQSNGIEDVRLVAFREEDGRTKYFATYTAYDGRNILPQLFTTPDFRNFTFTTLNGPAAQNKGMALFPRRINGRYAMLSRHDGDSLFISYSDNVHFWNESRPISSPLYPWEILKMGNCGSPIETEAGWLVLTHGVGPLRKYCLGALLLDRKDPSRVIGRLREPLMSPEKAERDGYVPNVLYTCGALVHGGRLVLPYGMSDRATSFALIPLNELLAAMPPGSV